MSFWKIYCLVLIFLLIPTHCYAFVRGEPRIWEIFNLIADSIAFLGLVGFSLERKILTKYFWMTYFPIFLVWSVLYMYFIPKLHIAYTAPKPSWFGTVDIVFSLTVNILWYAGLFLYAYMRDEIWE